MSKLNQKIVLFLEPADKAFNTPSKAGNLLMNRFAIDEDAQNEILKINQLEHNFMNILGKGLDLVNYWSIVHNS